jgi:hypothetical protein
MTVESKNQPSKPDDLSVILFRKNQKRMRRTMNPSLGASVDG